MSVACSLRRSPVVVGAILSALLLSGCTQMGTYQDAADPDAAKLRFVANTDNATVDYYDAEHCDGQTTGIINNLFIADSQRRVGMSVAPPEKARGYLEIKLPPEKDMYLKVNTQVGYAVCGSGFTFKPQSGTEYELTLDLKGRHCSTLMQRVQRIDGKDVRTPVAIKREGLAACAGRNAIFPKPPALLPDTPERTAMIDRIVNGSLFVVMKSGATKPTTFTPEKLDSLISERKAKMNIALPDDYWTLYRQNLVQFDTENASNADEAIKRASDEYRQRLRSVDDKRLKDWSRLKGSDGKQVNAAPNEMETDMIMYYFQSSKGVVVETVGRHLERMAKMDAQYDVCSRYADCWKR